MLLHHLYPVFSQQFSRSFNWVQAFQKYTLFSAIVILFLHLSLCLGLSYFLPSFLNMIQLSFIVFVSIIFEISLGSVLSPEMFNSAACCARGPECHKKHASLSKDCVMDKWMNEQSTACQNNACLYCNRNKQYTLCKTFPILKNCFNQGPPYPKPHPLWTIGSKNPKLPSPPSPKPTPKPQSTVAEKNCTFYPRNGITNIAATDFPVSGRWSRSDHGSVIWKKNGGSGIDRPTASGSFCVHFSPDKSGLHYFTVVSISGQFTEHNDGWFRFSENTVFYRPQNKSVKRKRAWLWMKGFQNIGKGKRAHYLLTFDNNGHQIFLNALVKDKKYTICVAGRSSKFQLFNVVVLYCKDFGSCSMFKESVKSVLAKLPVPAECV